MNLKSLALSSFVIFSFFIASQAVANPYAYVHQASPQDIEEGSPVNLLENSLARVFYFLSQPLPEDMDAVTNFVVDEVAPNFDFTYMSRWVAGRYYLRMDQQQQIAFENKFRDAYIANLVEKLTSYSNSIPVPGYFTSRQISETEAIASVDINYNDSSSVYVDFRYVLTPNGWKVIDVKANGISALLYYRNYFSSQLRSSYRR